MPPVRWPPRALSQPHDFLEIGNFAPFSEFLHIEGRHFPDFFPFKYTDDPYELWKISWKSVRTFFWNPEHRRTHRRGSFIDYYHHIDFLCQSRLETKITLREKRDEPYVYFIETWWQNTKPGTVFDKWAFDFVKCHNRAYFVIAGLHRNKLNIHLLDSECLLWFCFSFLASRCPTAMEVFQFHAQQETG